MTIKVSSESPEAKTRLERETGERASRLTDASNRQKKSVAGSGVGGGSGGCATKVPFAPSTRALINFGKAMPRE